MLTCKQAAALLTTQFDRALRPLERIRLHAHLLLCGICSRYAAQLRFLQRACRRADAKSRTPEVRLGEAARRRIRQAMDQARG